MTIIQVISLSIVEGISEFLPISSTGHLILAGSLLHIKQTDFVTSFEIFIQLGAILAIVLLYTKKLFVNRDSLLRIAVAFVPTGIIGYLLYKAIKHYLLGNPWVVVISLIVGGFILIGLELFFKKLSENSQTFDKLPLKNAAFIGLIQSLSVIPGVSRSAATIIGGQFAGLSRKNAVEFSFLLAVPTMAAATGLDLVKSHAFSFSSYEWLLMGIGFVASCITALIVVKVFLKMIQKKNTFLWFGVYRIAIALLYTAIVIR
jgi:undecaprenyl-diphosphatase